MGGADFGCHRGPQLRGGPLPYKASVKGGRGPERLAPAQTDGDYANRRRMARAAPAFKDNCAAATRGGRRRQRRRRRRGRQLVSTGRRRQKRQKPKGVIVIVRGRRRRGRRRGGGRCVGLDHGLHGRGDCKVAREVGDGDRQRARDHRGVDAGRLGLNLAALALHGHVGVRLTRRHR